MAIKASASRIERYSANVDELKAARRKGILMIGFWITLCLVDWIAGIMIFYHDKNIGLEPIFWVILLGIFLVCFIGEFFAFQKFTKANKAYHEAVDRYEKLIGKPKSEQGASDAK